MSIFAARIVCQLIERRIDRHLREIGAAGSSAMRADGIRSTNPVIPANAGIQCRGLSIEETGSRRTARQAHRWMTRLPLL